MTPPKLGELVIYIQGNYELGAPFKADDFIDDVIARGSHSIGTNGTREHAAIVTRVWTANCVNLCVFFDAAPTPSPRSSVMHVDACDGIARPYGTWRRQ